MNYDVDKIKDATVHLERIDWTDTIYEIMATGVHYAHARLRLQSEGDYTYEQRQGPVNGALRHIYDAERILTITVTGDDYDLPPSTEVALAASGSVGRAVELLIPLAPPVPSDERPGA